MQRVLIVEDEIFVALELESILEELGHVVVGIAADTRKAIELAALSVDVALVDYNLRDGATGAALGQRLAREFGIKVIFQTANPTSLGKGVPGTIGVLSKPHDADQVENAIDFVTGRSPSAPRAFVVFSRDASA
ncbi:response regulator [Rhizobium sp. FKL33]|uniref:response regulator n=1 Tax=Rhizobium sp. FKL33 TaxID=2562307 RepID=UPI001485B374|nr:response regulator [Rhizobium sp. FKL33]